MVPAARRALDEAEDILGYQTYVDDGRTLPRRTGAAGSDNREELQRARHAFELAATGRAVVLVSSGDPGVFAMAAAVLEALHGAGRAGLDAVELRIFPARLGGPGHRGQGGGASGPRFLLAVAVRQPQALEVIERRLDPAGAADLAMVFYNPIRGRGPATGTGAGDRRPPSFAADPGGARSRHRAAR
ncbi:SAM-dependent methyltransferase [Pseudomonas aeruginosa]|nr:SAM-dependent methyltransferase [Pseudomonas aeruginosa]